MKRAALIALALLGLALSPIPGRADEVGDKVVAGIALTTTVYAAKCDPLLPDDTFVGILDAVRTNLTERGVQHQFYIAMKYAVRMDFSQSVHEVAPIIPGDLNTFCAQMKPSIKALRESLDAGTLIEVLALGDPAQLGDRAPHSPIVAEVYTARRAADAL